MATVKIFDTKKEIKSISEKDFANTKITEESFNIKITDGSSITKNLKEKDFAITKIIDSRPQVKLSSVLQFRVKFTNIQIPGYGPNNVPPIGIAIIGINNYIL